MTYWVGIDVGGTFTDLVAIDHSAQTMVVSKVPTTLSNQAYGILAALAAADIELADVDVIVHGTTTGTNAVIERKGARTGLLTTSGFGDILDLGRRTRPHLYGLAGAFTPLIPRHLRREVDGRMTSQGEIDIPLDEAGIQSAVKELLDAGCESLAISFVNSYVAPEHEVRAAEIAREMWPNQFVSVGTEILPQIREFERTTTTVLNALLQPLITRYMRQLIEGLSNDGFVGELLVTQANGGVISGVSAGQAAVHTVLSGPAAGVTAAAFIGGRAGYSNVLSADMGGTSFDVAMVREGVPKLTSEKDLSYKIPLRVPTIDMATIGAGGGSLAFVDRQGILRVGPESAGSDPGPVSYGRGGSRPTLTDANVWLGRLNPAHIPGVGDMPTLELVEAAIAEHVAGPLGIDVDQAAIAILRVANDTMAGAVRLVSIERGVDPRDFALVSFGGAGPLHALSIADELGIPTIIVPPRPGVTSALGCLIADLRRDYLQTLPATTTTRTVDEINAVLGRLREKGLQEIESERVRHESVHVSYRASMHYEGQFHEVEVEFEAQPSSMVELDELFEAAYTRLYGAPISGGTPSVSSVGVAVTAKRPDFGELRFTAPSSNGVQPASTRRAWFDEGWTQAKVIERFCLQPGDTIVGPAVLEQEDSTVVVESYAIATVDEELNLLISLGRDRHDA